MGNSENREHMPPVVFPAYASTRSPPSERRALLSERLGKAIKETVIYVVRSCVLKQRVSHLGFFVLYVYSVYLFLSHGGSVRFIVMRSMRERLKQVRAWASSTLLLEERSGMCHYTKSMVMYILLINDPLDIDLSDCAFPHIVAMLQ